jgi:hypothetical protein
MSFRIVIASIFLMISFVVRSQPKGWRQVIQQKVEESDVLFMKSQITFRMERLIKPERLINELWHFTTDKQGRVIVFEIRSYHGEMEMNERYYLDDEELICMEEYRIVYPEMADDFIESGAVLFFVNGEAKQMVAIGKAIPKAGFDSLGGAEQLSKFKERFKILKENLYYVQGFDNVLTKGEQ